MNAEKITAGNSEHLQEGGNDCLNTSKEETNSHLIADSKNQGC